MLSANDAATIRKLAEKGRTVKEMARFYQVGTETIRRILRGETHRVKQNRGD